MRGRDETRAAAGARPAGAGAPCPQPVIPAAPSEMLKRHNANSFALWPPRRCHGAAAENKHNSPHVFSAPSTPRPSAPAPALASQDQPRLYCTVPHCTHFRNGAGLLPASPGEGQQRWHAAPGSPTVLVQGPARGTMPGGGMERGRGSGQGQHKERTRTAPGMLTRAPRPPLLGGQLAPSPAPLRFRAQAKGRRPAEPRAEKSRSPATTQPGWWHPALPHGDHDARMTSAAASRRGETDSGEPAAKEMPSLRGHGRLV